MSGLERGIRQLEWSSGLVQAVAGPQDRLGA